MTLALVLLDVDPSIVRPGWTAGLVTLFLLVALALLFISVRKQVGKISPDLPRKADIEAEQTPRPAPDITGKKH